MKVCAKCGQEHQWCKAHRNGTVKAGDPQPCNNRKIPPGSDVCTHHGAYAGRKGRAFNKRKLEEIEQYANAKEIVATYGEPVENVNPVEQVLELISWSAGHVKWLRAKVQETSPDGLIWGTTEHVESTEDVKTKEVAAPSVWLKLYNEERDRLAEICDKAVKNGIEAKRVQLAAHLGGMLLGILERFSDGILAALEREGWDRSELLEVWPEVRDEVTAATLAELEAPGASTS